MTKFKTLARLSDGKEIVLFGEDVPGRTQRAFYKEFLRFGHAEYKELQKVVIARRIKPLRGPAPRRRPPQPKEKRSIADRVSRFFGAGK